MSELKNTHIKMVYNGEVYDDLGTVQCTNLYYRKSEADKVIAEKDKEIQRLENLYKEIGRDNKRLLYYKYKRCLAIAKWCERKRVDAANYRIPREKWEFYEKWHKRWHDIAQFFKEAK